MAAPISGVRALGASAAASAASRSARADIDAAAPGSARQETSDRPPATPAAAAADEAPTADGAERAVRRPWRTRCGGRARATATGVENARYAKERDIRP